jgi:hypothetical protein
MANRNFNRYQALEKEVKVLFCKFSVDGSGTPTLDAINSKGIESVTLLSTGRYEFKLEDRYNALLHLTFAREYVGAGAIGTNNVIRSEDVDGARTIIVENIDSTGTPTNFLNGTILRVRIELKNTSVR